MNVHCVIKCDVQEGGIEIWKCWFLWREENRRTRRKTPGASTRTNNKLNPHMTPNPASIHAADTYFQFLCHEAIGTLIYYPTLDRMLVHY